ncbi:MAG TPA: dicarboxylate/amino acid:cation symporter, partial [Vicinamibacteria bacterium]|nr:dicarboxylate/amino acid:cation symporter [Vicinamibacteria bacterium]
MSSPPKPRIMSPHAKVTLGLAAGALFGLIVNLLVERGAIPRGALDAVVSYATRPLGQIFLNMLFMVVVPIVFASLALGVAKLGHVGQFGRLSFHTFSYFVLTTTASALLGLLLVNVFQPGRGFDSDARDALLETFGEEASEKVSTGATGFSVDMVVDIVSRNPVREAAEMRMLPIIFFAMLFGAALIGIREELRVPVLRLVEGIGEIMATIVGYAMRLAPYAVFALVFNVTARLGLDVVKQLGLFVVLVFSGYLLHLFGTYSLLLALVIRYPPRLFFKKVTPVMVTAFSTSSSNATLPTTIRHAERDLGVPPQIAGFVLPVGATTNMNGTSLFEAVLVLFLAQVFGVELSLGSQALVVVLSVLTAIGAAGVPSGAIPLIVGVLETVGVPGEAIALIIGVDRILDMGRTVVNVTGDVTAACFVSRRLGLALEPVTPQ